MARFARWLIIVADARGRDIEATVAEQDVLTQAHEWALLLDGVMSS